MANKVNHTQSFSLTGPPPPSLPPGNDVGHARKPHLFRPIGSHSSVLALKQQSVTLECIPKGL